MSDESRALASAPNSDGHSSDPVMRRPKGISMPFGKYQLIAAIGSGGMAEIFLGIARGPVGFNKLVVIKRLRANLASENEDFVSMFLDEARLAARLNHPNIVQTYEVGTHEDALFIAMEYLEGQSLKRICSHAEKHGPRLPIPMAVRIVADALAGLHYAHELRDYDGQPLDVVHRDVSPHNVFVTYEGGVKLVDFGIAKAALNSTQTETGTFKGKPGYMAPEQVTSDEYDRRADVFAMGIVLFELVTATRLFPGDAVQALHNVISGKIPRASETCADVDPALDEIIDKALKRRAEERYATAEEMRRDLESWLRTHATRVESGDIGNFVSGMFGDVRESIRKLVEVQMSSISSSRSDSGITLRHAPSTIDVAVDVGIDVAQGDLAPLSTSNPKRRWMWLGLLGGLVALLIVVGLALGRSSPKQSLVASASASASASVARKPGALVTITSEPAGAAAQWNGLSIGVTPVTIELPPGPQSITLSKDGFQSAEVRVDVPTSVEAPLVQSASLVANTPPTATSAALESRNGKGHAPATLALAVSKPKDDKPKATAVDSATTALPAPPPTTTTAPPTRPNVKILDVDRPHVKVIQ